jgi:UDP-N-acetyl-D-mannosaminuronic acid dehydrogenase
MEKICVVGLGYIGLPTASLLATKGYQVTGVDVDQKVVDTINQGKIHIHEPDLDILVKAAVQSGNLKASTAPTPADIFILAVPTPFKADHQPDISFVESATRSIASVLKPGNLLILESTSPVGTTEQIGTWLRELRPDLTLPPHPQANIGLAHCPERVLPGQILKELVNNDRVIGGVDEASAKNAKKFYESFVTGNIFLTNSRTAELTKLTENAFRDVNIAFANELSLICERLNINVWELIKLANRHPRVNILQPGPGVGGHCIAVDPWFIVSSAPKESRLLRTAREVNNSKPHHVVEKVKAACAKISKPTIACLGLSFKADIDDLRESPAVEITKLLADSASATVLVAEPHISKLPAELSKMENIQLTNTQEAIRKADVVLLLVSHKAFLNVDKALLQGKTVVDTRGVWE